MLMQDQLQDAADNPYFNTSEKIEEDEDDDYIPKSIINQAKKGYFNKFYINNFLKFRYNY